MNLPNRLTLMRILLVPAILCAMLPLTPRFTAWSNFTQSLGGHILALVLFSIASLTDMLDGKIARKRGLVTNMGKFLDPLADKLLVLSVFIAFTDLGRVHSILVVIILARELAVTGIRLLAAHNGKVIAASYYGKVKTVTQMIAIIWLMLEPILSKLFYAEELDLTSGNGLILVGDILLVVVLFTTVASGLDYLLKNLQLIKD